MASGTSPATFESWLNQATSPDNQEDRWDCIQSFYQLVNQETDGPQVAVQLLTHKIHSPQEKEALQALTVLEACMNNCGKRFQKEAAKFRFLNELIKLLTPKYFGAWTPQRVKDRVTEVLYGWTLWLKDEPKIQEAYSMLKKQGIVKKDPKLPDTVIMAPPPQRPADSVFDQEEKAKLLARLLKSARPEDLETANRLIKSTMKEEQEKAEKLLKRESTLKEVESCTKQLRELLDQSKVSGAPLQPSEEVKAAYERCDRLRPSLFRLASDTMEDDAALALILAANDDLTLAVNAYKEHAAKNKCNARREEDGTAPTSPRGVKSYHLIDLSALDSPETRRKADSPPAFYSAAAQDLNESETENLASKRTPGTKTSYYVELMQLKGDLQVKDSEQNGGAEVLLKARGCRGTGDGITSNGTSTWPLHPHQQFTESGSLSQKRPNDELLTNIFVPLETIRWSLLEPLTLYDRAGVRVSLHFAKDSPAAHPGTAVVIVSTVNTSALDVSDFVFQAAVPKSMSVKLQPASGTHLPPYNPLLPPPAISQVLLLTNPEKRKVRLRFKLTLTHGRQHVNETREIDDFPDWTSLISH